MNSPDIPNPTTAAIAGSKADLANFPLSYMVNALAQEGGKQTINGTTYDFTGMGNADQSAKMSDPMAQALLDIQKNYGSAYIQQRLADLKQSDPTGYAARQQLFDKILADSKANPDRPLATDLQKQVNDMLGTAGNLDPQAEQQIQQQVRGNQVAKGIYLGTGPAAEENIAVVNASDALRAEQQQAAYRRIQQSLSNLGAFVNNQTPEAQFGQLSGAQNGAAPFSTPNYTTPANVNPNSAANGVNFADNIYAQQAGFAANQANPWLTGLSTGINAIGAFSNLGWKPFGTAGNPGATIAAQTNLNNSIYGTQYLNQAPLGTTDLPTNPGLA